MEFAKDYFQVRTLLFLLRPFGESNVVQSDSYAIPRYKTLGVEPGDPIRKTHCGYGESMHILVSLRSAYLF